MLAGAVGDSCPQTSLQYRYGWGTGHGQEVIAYGGVGTSGKCAYWPRAWEKGVAKGRKSAPAGDTGLRNREQPQRGLWNRKVSTIICWNFPKHLL